MFEGAEDNLRPGPSLGRSIGIPPGGPSVIISRLGQVQAPVTPMILVLTPGGWYAPWNKRNSPHLRSIVDWLLRGYLTWASTEVPERVTVEASGA